MQKTLFTRLVLWSLTLAIALFGCGSDNTAAQYTPVVFGIVAAESTITAKVTLKDSSTPQAVMTTKTGPDGYYSFDTTLFKAPFLLTAETWAADPLYAFSPGPGIANINPFSTVVVKAAVEASGPQDIVNDDMLAVKTIADRAPSVSDGLKAKLAPLFQLYGITEDPVGGNYAAESADFSALFTAVTMKVNNGVILITNTQKDTVIFAVSETDINSGTFYPENMPSQDPGQTSAPAPSPASTAPASTPNTTPAGETLTQNPSPGQIQPSSPAPVEPTAPTTPAQSALKDSQYVSSGLQGYLGRIEINGVLLGVRISVTSSYTISQVGLQMYRVGVPDQNIVIGIYTHDSANNQPGARIGAWSKPVNNGSLTIFPGEKVTFTGLQAVVKAGTYWIVAYPASGSGDNHSNYSGIAGTNQAPYFGDEHLQPRDTRWGEKMYAQVNYWLYGS